MHPRYDERNVMIYSELVEDWAKELVEDCRYFKTISLVPSVN